MEMKKKSLGKEILVVLAETAMLVSLVILFVCPVSCKVTELGIQLVPANYESPVIEEFSVKSEKNLEMVFSHSVKLASLSVSPKNVVKDIKYDNPDSGEKCFVRIEFSDGLVVGEKYSISGTATDEFGNSLTFSRPFTGFNANEIFRRNKRKRSVQERIRALQSKKIGKSFRIEDFECNRRRGKSLRLSCVGSVGRKSNRRSF